MWKLVLLFCLQFCSFGIAVSKYSQDEANESLLDIITSQSKEIEDLRAMVMGVKHTNTKQDDQLQILQREMNSMRSNDRNKRLLLMNSPIISHQTVAFTARLSTHVTGLGNQQPIVFDDVITNVGNAYSPVVGIFTAPNNGTYFFFASIMGHLNEYIETEMVKNGAQIALTYSYGNNRYDQSSNGAVVNLKEGDKVWVRHQNQEGQKVYGSSWSSFSGFQIGL